MKKVFSIVVLVAGVIFFAAFTLLDFDWGIDPNYAVKFSGKKAEGTFSGLKGVVKFDKNDLAHSKIDVAVDVSTIKTGNATKDKHAKGDSWFDADKYPQIKFNSTSFTKSSDKFVITGVLEMHGVKKEVQIPFMYSETGDKATFTGQFKVNRKDYGIYGNFMGFAVGDEFNVTLNVPVTKK